MQLNGSWAARLSLLKIAGLIALLQDVCASPIQERAESTTSSTALQTSSIASITSGTSNAPSTVSTGATVASTTLSGTGDSDLVTSTLSSASAGSAPTNVADAPPNDDPYPECHEEDIGPFSPFCLPQNGSDKYPGDNYYITWDPDLLPENSTVTILSNYVNTTGAGGTNVWSSPRTPNGYGYVIITMDKSWLQGSSRNNITFHLNALDDTKDVPLISKAGPTISLTNPPVVHYPPPVHTPPNKLGMEVGIPIGIAFFLFILCGLFVGMRKHRHINVGSVMGRRKGYGVGKSRRQRLGLGNKTGIHLGDNDLNTDGRNQYTDQPTQDVELQTRTPGHGREDSLGSLVNSPTREGFEANKTPRSNAFRDEISRQRTGH